MDYRMIPVIVFCCTLVVAGVCLPGVVSAMEGGASQGDQRTQQASREIVIHEDVHVRGRMQWRDTEIQVYGNIILHEGGELTIENATLSLMCSYTREFRVQWEGGTLTTRNVTIGGAELDGKAYQTYFEIQHGAWKSEDTTIRYSSGVTMGWTGRDVTFHAERLKAGPHPDSIIMSCGAADVMLKDSDFNISLAVSAARGGRGILELPVNEPVTRVFDASNVPGVSYRLELVNTTVDLWWAFFSGIQQDGPPTEVVLGRCPRLIPSIIAYDLQGELELPAPWPTRPEEATQLSIGNLKLTTTGQPVRTWCWGLYVDGPRSDVVIRGKTNICELFLSAGRMLLEGDPDTFNAVNACTTVEVGRRQAAAVPSGDMAVKGSAPVSAELVMRNVSLGRFAKGDEIVGQLTAHDGGTIVVEHARCAPLKLLTKGDGVITLSNLQLEGELQRIGREGSITW